jgi:ABC-type siderophore export system fused ATPase/permease subunit
MVFGGLTLLRTIRRRKADNIKLSYSDVLFYGSLGLEFGLLVTFGWQAFHRPLIFLVVLAFVGCVVTGARPLKSSQRSHR